MRKARPWIWFVLAIAALIVSFVEKALSVMFLLLAIAFCIGGIVFMLRR